jgi:hypothetical protein
MLTSPSLFSFITLIATTLPFTTAAPADTSVTVSYDNTYDNANLDLLTTSCSNGQNGLVTKGYPTAGKLPGFPSVGGAFTVAGWNSASCGACYKLTWQSNSIYVTAIDHTASGFNLAQAGMDKLTGGQAVQLGRITATYEDADPVNCGFK